MVWMEVVAAYFTAFQAFFWTDLRKPSVRKVGLLAEIRTRELPHTKQECDVQWIVPRAVPPQNERCQVPMRQISCSRHNPGPYKPELGGRAPQRTAPAAGSTSCPADTRAQRRDYAQRCSCLRLGTTPG